MASSPMGPQLVGGLPDGLQHPQLREQMPRPQFLRVSGILDQSGLKPLKLWWVCFLSVPRPCGKSLTVIQIRLTCLMFLDFIMWISDPCLGLGYGARLISLVQVLFCFPQLLFSSLLAVMNNQYIFFLTLIKLTFKKRNIGLSSFGFLI